MRLQLDYIMHGEKKDEKASGEYEVSCLREYIKYHGENYTNQRTCNYQPSGLGSVGTGTLR